MSNTPVRPAGANSPSDIADAFGKLAFALPGPKRIVRASPGKPKPQGR